MQDMLLHIDTYAEPTLPPAIDQAVAFAHACRARISALATHIDIRVPDNWLAERLLGVSQLVEVEENKSLHSARTSLKHFEGIARNASVFSENIVSRADLNGVGSCVARHARTRDLCVVPALNLLGPQRAVV